MDRWDLRWHRLKGYAETRCVDSAAEAAVEDESPDAVFYQALMTAYQDILCYLDVIEGGPRRH